MGRVSGPGAAYRTRPRPFTESSVVRPVDMPGGFERRPPAPSVASVRRTRGAMAGAVCTQGPGTSTALESRPRPRVLDGPTVAYAAGGQGRAPRLDRRRLDRSWSRGRGPRCRSRSGRDGRDDFRSVGSGRDRSRCYNRTDRGGSNPPTDTSPPRDKKGSRIGRLWSRSAIQRRVDSRACCLRSPTFPVSYRSLSDFPRL
jgi:hypothetical protein